MTLHDDGSWVFLDEDERSILETIDHDSDRAIAIIVGSMIENRLERAIIARSQRDKKIEERLFRSSGPLGSFSGKIDIAYLNGVISSQAHADLSVLKDIRNSFAHDLGIKDFQSQKVKDKAANFKLVDTRVVDPTSKVETKDRIATLGHDAIEVLYVRNAEARKKRARDRYLLTAQVFTIRLAPADLAEYPLPLI